jgi:site-specific recombinase XerD
VSTPANDALLASWRLSLHDKRPRTIALYLDEANRFATWLAEHERPAGAPGDLLTIDRQDAEAWIHDLQAAGLAKATIRSRWIALRNLYGWLVDEDEIDVSPLAKVKVPKPDAPPPDVLPEAALRALLKACEGRAFEDRRDAALIRFMVATGLRVSEVCSLTTGDVDLMTRLVTVRSGKGDKARVVRFDAATAAALDRYRRVRGRHPRYAQRPEFWIGFRGPLTRKGVPLVLDKRAAMAGIGHVHAHQLRHTWAHRWLSNGGTEGDLQLLGGWANAEVMRRYGAAQATDRALAAYDNINPLRDL